MGFSRPTLALCAWFAITPIASAQDIVPPSSLKGQLLDLARRTNIAAVGSPDVVGDSDVDLLSVLTALEVSTAPFGSSTGSFTFTFDSETGTFVRTAESFGPAFGKRSLTNGKGKLSAGFNWLHASYGSLGNLDLQNGDTQPVRNVRAPGGGPTPLPDASQLRASIASDTLVGFASFGLTDSLDVGVAVPWVRIAVRADVALIKDGVDRTPGGNLLVMPEESAQGVGDIALLAKYRAFQKGNHGAAIELELRLPSGDPDNLRGTGVTRTLVSAVWSRAGTISPHASLGLEFWSSGVSLSQAGDVRARNQINYNAGLEIIAHPRATLLLDIVGRRQLGGGMLEYRTEALGPYLADFLRVVPEAVDAVAFAPGIKWNVAANVLLSGNVLASISNRGLRAAVVPVVGFEWAF